MFFLGGGPGGGETNVALCVTCARKRCCVKMKNQLLMPALLNACNECIISKFDDYFLLGIWLNCSPQKVSMFPVGLELKVDLSTQCCTTNCSIQSELHLCGPVSISIFVRFSFSCCIFFAIITSSFSPFQVHIFTRESRIFFLLFKQIPFAFFFCRLKYLTSPFSFHYEIHSIRFFQVVNHFIYCN